jgi:hypothetical protein
VRLSRAAARLGLVLCSLAAAGVVLEFALRWFDPLGTSYYRDTNRYLQHSILLPPEAARPDGRLFENAPSRELVAASSTFATDAAGLRAESASAPAPRPRPEATDVGVRLLFLGDSVTLGWGVDWAETWIAAVQREGRAADGRAVEALQAGHLQYNTVQSVDWFQAHGAALEPDVVVYTAVMNDLDDSYALYLAFVEAQARAAAAPPGRWARASAALRGAFPGLGGLAQFWRERRAARQPDPEQGTPVAERALYREGWPRAEAALDRLLGECRRLGAALLIFDHTTPRLPGFEVWARERGVPWHDFTFTPEEWARPIRNSAADSHANAAGHRLLARKALAALRAEGWLAPAAGDGQ